ncbi:SDR family NAD(P)-dependent oxidoreductase [Cellvibrio sp. QJXJ]|uniref:SDR family NAD(P)-dependent oxidoreductase n=1 Tax=Cellvibrio sp. QJXJ TaxID=2964606 RepID=UPI0021C3F2C5|nr:SDR family NAD(P)-dependent oxidoreductase [Cellvibrio sp. QJXJ]
MAFSKVVIVTGGSRGIGAETAKLFAQHGYAVCINYLANDEAAENLKRDIIQSGGQCIAIKADVF